MGLHQAGFDVTGVDIKYRKNYPFDILVTDCLALGRDFLSLFDFVWASPCCQRFSVATPADRKAGHPDQIEDIRQMLAGLNALTAIENVPGAPLRPDVVMTGCQFGLKTYRRRHFELNFPMLWHEPGQRFGPETVDGAVTVAGHSGGNSGNVQQWREAMEIDWMTSRELAQAIPPVYAKSIGDQAMRLLLTGRRIDQLVINRPGEAA